MTYPNWHLCLLWPTKIITFQCDKSVMWVDMLKTKSNNSIPYVCMAVCIMHFCFLSSTNSIHVKCGHRGSFGHKSCLNTSANTLCHRHTTMAPNEMDDKFAMTMDDAQKIYVFHFGNDTESPYLFYVQGWRCELFVLFLFILSLYLSYFISPNPSLVARSNVFLSVAGKI